MRTVNEVSKLTGVSIRTLHYYDEIGLLSPTSITEAGYRLYDDTALERLQHIMLFRELEFPLKDIKEIVNGSNFDRNKALEQQIQLLTLKKEHIENLIIFARGIQGIGVKNMDFSAFDAKKLDEYAAQAKASWGKTEAYKEFEEKEKNRTTEQSNQIAEGMMALFTEFGLLLKEGKAAVLDYLDFLSGGCSKSPLDLLKGAGVDMTTPEPVNSALALFDRLLDEMEALMEV